MQSRRKILMVVLVAVIVLMLAGAGVLLARGFMAFSKAERQLGGKKAELDALYARNPFPSGDNLKIEHDNLGILNDQVDDLLKEMGRGQVESVEQGRTTFMPLFWSVKKAMDGKAREHGVKLAESVDYGFGRSMQGIPPEQQDVARLTQQLKIVQKLSDVLFESGISELDGVGREEFEVETQVGGGAEKEARPRSRRRPAESATLNVREPLTGLIPDGMLFGRWRFVFRFTAKEGALLALLNRLAKDPLFAVVTDLEVLGDETVKSITAQPVGKETKGAADAVEGAVPAVVPRDLRIVCGRDVPLKVKMELEVYQFKLARPPKAAKSGEGSK